MRDELMMDKWNQLVCLCATQLTCYLSSTHLYQIQRET